MWYGCVYVWYVIKVFEVKVYMWFFGCCCYGYVSMILRYWEWFY